ncbi:hypothetical protein BIU82_12545 [Arthrobacter sp. SW1]|uniref:DUF1905 domain-containing protein n=1 Tax=Arthrobacter sp. SW1 TaxID=1920889 RepID=UPI000877DA9B|nr:DUF1905 domain-containing protein [Arthrobacter sp. SW1]OFI36592.1 hypothetical protein BIU82_12545 [Arthrobacter sp. SW1]
MAAFAFDAVLWRIPEEAGWHFITLPVELAADLREETAQLRKGFGSIKVTATVASTSWSTSVFPDSKSGSYLLPVKKAVRTATGIHSGDTVSVHLEVDAGI